MRVKIVKYWPRSPTVSLRSPKPDRLPGTPREMDGRRLRIFRTPGVTAVVVLLLQAFAAAAEANIEFRYVSLPPEDAVVVDTRTLEQCTTASLPGTRCLPASDLLGPHARLPSFRDIVWVFGTLGLGGDETVAVVGSNHLDRDFVAGLLFLAGQGRVVVVSEPVARLLAGGREATPGMRRKMVRSPVYGAVPRYHLLVLREELWEHLQGDEPPRLLDGRTDEEFRGEWVRANRGGRLPGAEFRPDGPLRASLPIEPVGSPRPVVAYAHDPLESLAYFTLLRAGAGIEARVYAEGFREWAVRGDLPLDHETLPERIPGARVSPAAVEGENGRPLSAAVAVFGVLALVALVSFFLGRKRWIF